MRADNQDRDSATPARDPILTRLRRFVRSKDGATAIEFALLAVPYFIIIFAIIETFVAFTAEQLITNATDTMSRKLRTGQITYNLGRSTDMTQVQFRTAFCAEISIMIGCSASEIATPAKLYLDVETYTSFGAIPTTIPRISTAAYADIDTSGFKFAPGGPSSINMVRAYYRWQVTADIVRPYITNIHPANGSMPTDFLIIATTAFSEREISVSALNKHMRQKVRLLTLGWADSRCMRMVRRLAQDTRGIGAIEFAILVPVLLLLYLGALQTTIALSVAQRASRAAGTIADIVTQQSSLTKSTLATMPSVANAIFVPYTISGMTLKITGIQIDANSKATVLWSWEQDGTTAYTAGSVVTAVPADMNKASSFLVRAELGVPYKLISFGPDFLPAGMNSITMKRQYFYRQRTGTSITCSDC